MFSAVAAMVNMLKAVGAMVNFNMDIKGRKPRRRKILSVFLYLKLQNPSVSIIVM